MEALGIICIRRISDVINQGRIYATASRAAMNKEMGGECWSHRDDHMEAMRCLSRRDRERGLRRKGIGMEEKK